MTLARSFIIASALAASTCIPAWARFEPVTCKNSFTPQQEVSEGNKVASQVYQQMPVLPENDPVTQYVQQLGARLVANAPPTPGTNGRWPFTFHVVSSGDINAFALPGGSIFVNLGTVQAAETEAQLAGVMAHEISHVVMRHSTCNLGKQRNRSLLYGIGAIGSAILLGNGAVGQLAQTGLGVGQSLDFLHMSRDDEKQADLLGANILNNAGYDPRGLPQFFEVIQAKYGRGGAQLLSDHPNPGNRTEYVNAEIATLTPRSNPIVTTAGYRQVHSLALNEHALSAKEVQSGYWKGTGRYADRPGSNGAVIPVSTASNTGGYGNGPVDGRGDGRGDPRGDGRGDGQGNGQGGMQGGSPTGLSRASLGLDDQLQTLQADSYTIRYPPRWQRNQNGGALTLYPQGGASEQGIVYGVLIETAPNLGQITDAQALSQATARLVDALREQNQGMSQTSDIQSITIAGRRANAVDLRGRSPLSMNGSSLAEHDLLVTSVGSDGTLTYLVFIAPERDFAMLRPTYTAMLSSLRLR